jgi:hypothetical protein
VVVAREVMPKSAIFHNSLFEEYKTSIRGQRTMKRATILWTKISMDFVVIMNEFEASDYLLHNGAGEERP